MFVFTSNCKGYRFFKVVSDGQTAYHVQRRSLDAGWVGIGRARDRHQAEMKCILNQRRIQNV
jgi:hypothetical protein